MSNQSLQTFKDEMSKKVFGRTQGEALEKGICISCGSLAAEKCHSEEGRREYLISGLCEECFDELFEEEEED